METIIQAIKSNDLVKAGRAFNAIMAERTKELVESRKLEVTKLYIEGEEPIDDDVDDESEDDESEDDKKDDKKAKKEDK
ncbi:hypothetical protein TH1_006 [Shewanella phage Thanatos-1]|nr:hypothetical protein TH1_006 [Shewanella phage Thanatos-1]QLA10576.1 hypothetical protein TH2_008 [Shewanella phage Thanatos-2]